MVARGASLDKRTRDNRWRELRPRVLSWMGEQTSTVALARRMQLGYRAVSRWLNLEELVSPSDAHMDALEHIIQRETL